MLSLTNKLSLGTPINVLTVHTSSLHAPFLLTVWLNGKRTKFGWRRSLSIAVTKKIQLWFSKGDVFLNESQNEIHLPITISVINNISLTLVSDTYKGALGFIISHYSRSSRLPFSWTETDFPSFEADSLRSQTPKRYSCGPQKAMWFCTKQRISSLDRALLCKKKYTTDQHDV